VLSQDNAYQAKLKLLAAARGEDEHLTQKRFSRGEILGAPSFSKHLTSLRRQKLASVGVADGLGWVELDDGHRFFSPKSHSSLVRQYDYVEDTLDPMITRETFLAAIDVTQRYLTDAAWPSPEIFSHDVQGTTVVELGAYLGHKTIRFAEAVAPFGGRVLAVEMMPDNYEILRKNIVENGLADVVDTRLVGVWSSRGSVSGVGKGRQRRSLHHLEQLGRGESFDAQVDTLDGIVESWQRKSVNLVFATINGAEVEMLKGFSFKRVEVKNFFIAAPYVGNLGTRSGAEFCYDELKSAGYRLLTSRGGRRIEAARG